MSERNKNLVTVLRWCVAATMLAGATLGCKGDGKNGQRDDDPASQTEDAQGDSPPIAKSREPHSEGTSTAEGQTSNGEATGSIESRSIAVEPEPVTYVYPAYVSRYDIATRRELKYTVLLDPFLGDQDDLASWGLLADIGKELGDVVGDILDAKAIANTLTTAFSIGGAQTAQAD